MAGVETLEAELERQCSLSMKSIAANEPISPEAAKRAKAIISASLTAASNRDLVIWLARMHQLVRGGANAGEDDIKAQYAVYAEKLREYPADIVRATLDDWPNHSQFWPTWCELAKIMDPQVALRRAVLGALEHRALPKPDERASFIAELEKADPARAAILGGAPYTPPPKRHMTAPRPIAPQPTSEDPAEREAMRAAAAAKLRASIESEGEGPTP